MLVESWLAPGEMLGGAVEEAKYWEIRRVSLGSSQPRR
jgi:hypothetical protein